MMKSRWMWASVLLALMTVNALAKSRSELEVRIRELTAQLEALQGKPDKQIPEHLLAKAKGIVLMERRKAGFIFAYQGGGGVALVRDPKSGAWSPPAFLKADEGSLGFQVGSQKSFLVFLLMTDDATRLLTDSTFQFGGEARGTAGSESSGVEGSVESQEAPVVVYSDVSGLYGGVSVKAGSFSPDDKANRVYYPEYPLSVKEIVIDRKVKPTEAGTALGRKIDELAKKK